MNLKAFFVAALSSALDLGIAIPDDVLRHVTPHVLAFHLPRPLWARLLTACVGAPRVDAQLVVETIGVPNLCEHVPTDVIWACIAEIGARSLGGVVMAPASAMPMRATPIVAASSPAPSEPLAASGSRPVPLATPPPPPASEPKPPEPKPVAVGPSIPSIDDDNRGRAPADRRFRPSTTSMGRLATNAGTQRRPQAQATTPPTEPVPERSDRGDRGDRSADRAPERSSPHDRFNDRAPTPAPVPARPRRGQTEADYDLETFVGGKDDWKTSLAVEDEQLVDWASSDETVAGDEIGRKR